MKSAWIGLGLLLSGPAAAWQSPLGGVEVHDRATGQVLPVHQHDGRRYVVGEPGHEYQLVLRNHGGGRLLAVASVDGVNVISGQTASTGQSGYVLAPYDSTTVAGWRKSLDETAAFYFTAHRNSYAARTGRPLDVGVIGVALFREKNERCCRWFGLREEDALGDQAAGAPSAAPEVQSRRRESSQEKLGTGHGRREHSSARYTEFERASDTPDEVLTIYYDSRANLVAQGVLPRDWQYAQRRPRAFSGGFAPDP